MGLVVKRRETLDDADEALEKVAESLDTMQQRVAPEQRPAEAARDYCHASAL